MPGGTHTAASALMFTATLLTAGVAASQDARPARTIVLRVDDYARLPPDVLRESLDRASRIFAAAGVRLIVWNHAEQRPQVAADWDLTLSILSEKMAERKIAADGIPLRVLGNAAKPARRAYVLTHRVAKVAANYGRPLGAVLGTVIAHEVGHLVLPGSGHSKIGIMGANLEDHLRAKAPVEFTEEQVAAIRAAATSPKRDLDFRSEEHRPIAILAGPFC